MQRETIVSISNKTKIEEEEEKEAVESELKFIKSSTSRLFRQTIDGWLVINHNFPPMIDDKYYSTSVFKKESRSQNDPQHITSTNQENIACTVCIIF